MNVVHSLTLPIHTLYSQVQVPISHSDNQTQEVVPFPPWVETGRPPQHLNLVWASPGSCLNLSNPDPSPQPPPSSSGEGAMYKRGVDRVQTSLPTRAATE
ncbi:hypothetical protein CHARACLAT_033502 [Characodon lateralis]|uniref:Uncharacterized protein n=1 Tax=Characodon lateralis TaxID=208331 RepID=A0ABU7EF12_9TELE|nr:hypothetical protein [Characodon lateralis]